MMSPGQYVPAKPQRRPSSQLWRNRDDKHKLCWLEPGSAANARILSLVYFGSRSDKITAGTFARVTLCRDKTTRDYYALKVLAIHDIIRLKQVDHVKNEKRILQVRRKPHSYTLK